MSVRVTFMSDAEARIISLQSEAVVLRSTLSSAPGSRPDVVLASGERLRAKIHRCRRVEGGFELTGRMLDMPRRVRQALVDALDEASSKAESEPASEA